ncbi:hypothetical protein PV325_003036 [Microctonus aethiopoides]|nr:hypothetical protein PV325_003036 [Microctonus aethiopoides]
MWWPATHHVRSYEFGLVRLGPAHDGRSSAHDGRFGWIRGISDKPRIAEECWVIEEDGARARKITREFRIDYDGGRTKVKFRRDCHGGRRKGNTGADGRTYGSSRGEYYRRLLCGRATMPELNNIKSW